MKASQVEPDPFRLTHREAIRVVVAEVVRAHEPVRADVVERRACGRVAEADLQAFVELVVEELEHLHEGNVAKYGLRATEWRAWVG